MERCIKEFKRIIRQSKGGTASTSNYCRLAGVRDSNSTQRAVRYQFAILGCLFALCTVALSSDAAAAVRYVDNTATGSNSGTSWADAWTSLGAIKGLSPGDTVYISGGTSGKTYPISNWSPPRGSSSSPITYAVGQDTGHNGMVTFTGSGNFLQNNLSDIVINGEVGGQRRMTAAAGYTWFIYEDGGNTNRFKVLYMNFYSPIWLRGSYVEIGYSKGVAPLSMMDDSFIAHIGDYSGAASGWGINKFHHNDIQVNRIKTSGFGQDGLKWCANIDVYNNTLRSVYNASYSGNQHNDGWQGNGAYVRFNSNYFENFLSYPIYLESYGNTSHWRIYNNVIYSGTESGIDWGAQQAIAIGFNPSSPGTFTDFIIANNTIIGNGKTRGIHFNYPDAGSVGSDVYIVNNIIYNSQSTVLYSDSLTAVANNIGGTAGLIFVNNDIYPNGNFHLTASATAAIGKGISPAYLTAAFTTDADGNTRTGTWDIGAYQFATTSQAGSTTSTPLPTVQNLTIQ